LLETEERYDLAMTFWRAQEFYESPRFQHQVFTQAEYMRWYAKEHGKGSFSYAKDWSGFNVPSSALESCYEHHTERLPYDRFMLHIMKACEFLAGDEPYYLIGANSKSHDVLQHEMAHGLFSTNLQYRAAMHDAWSSLRSDAKACIEIMLEGMGYAPSVWADEGQAYLATGISEKMEQIVTLEDAVPFQNIYANAIKSNEEIKLISSAAVDIKSYGH
jgi:hypothetical protein